MAIAKIAPSKLSPLFLASFSLCVVAVVSSSPRLLRVAFVVAVLCVRALPLPLLFVFTFLGGCSLVVLTLPTHFGRDWDDEESSFLLMTTPKVFLNPKVIWDSGCVVVGGGRRCGICVGESGGQRERERERHHGGRWWCFAAVGTCTGGGFVLGEFVAVL